VCACVCVRDEEGWEGAWALCLGCELKGELEIVIQTPLPPHSRLRIFGSGIVASLRR
jgi:hypothetical protein